MEILDVDEAGAAKVTQEIGGQYLYVFADTAVPEALRTRIRNVVLQTPTTQRQYIRDNVGI